MLGSLDPGRNTANGGGLKLKKWQLTGGSAGSGDDVSAHRVVFGQTGERVF
jgi:hypothetical protein